ncbi:MAG TPA: bifunctional nuclease family protein [Armatimonadota bacterium]|nr:bifunctional nuclease family protein [Armatimonadota bacterium]
MKEDDEEFEPGSEEFIPPEEQPGRPRRSDEDLTSEIENRQPRKLDEKEVQVIGVYEHQEQGLLPPGFSPPAFVLLRDKQGRQVLIFIDRSVAFAISLALEDKAADRPLTHDLLKNLADRLGCKIERVTIDDLWQDTYYARLSVSVNGNSMEIDARPSDAIALALRAKAPIYMAEYVLENASITEET